MGRGRRTRFNLSPQVFEQLEQLGAPGCARRDPHGRQGGHCGCSCLGRYLRFAIHVAVKALVGFATQPAASQALTGNDAGAVARFLKILVVDGFHDGVRHVQRGQVQQFKGTELETHLVFQNSIDRGEIGNALGHHTQRLGAVAPSCVIDDEAWGVLGANALVSHVLGQLAQGLAGGFAGGQARHNFHHFHQGDWIEKMKTGKALGVVQLRSQGGDGQRRGVAGNHCFVRQQVFKLGKQGFFDGDVFHHGFNDQITLLQIVQVFRM